jgi:hypothetical protein
MLTDVCRVDWSMLSELRHVSAGYGHFCESCPLDGVCVPCVVCWFRIGAGSRSLSFHEQRSSSPGRYVVDRLFSKGGRCRESMLVDAVFRLLLCEESS